MVDQSIIAEWLDRAEEDFRFAEANLKEGEEFFAQICFHFQQSAEKYLKAFIIAKGLPFSVNVAQQRARRAVPLRPHHHT